MTPLFQYKSKDPNGSFCWSHTELFGTVEELKLQHSLDPNPEWREVVIVPASAWEYMLTPLRDAARRWQIIQGEVG